MQSINIELRNYGVEIALWDRVSTHGAHHPVDIKELLNTDAINWMAADNPTPWREKRNGGFVRGLVFDSNLDITVKDSSGVVLDHFNGSDCFDLAYVYREYSAVTIRAWRHQQYGGRITGMEVSKEGFSCCDMDLHHSRYSRDKLHFGLSKVTHLYEYDSNGYWLHHAEAFVLDSHFAPPMPQTHSHIKPVNARVNSFSLNGPHIQKLFVSEYAQYPSKTYREANQRDCDSLNKYIISKSEFK